MPPRCGNCGRLAWPIEAEHHAPGCPAPLHALIGLWLIRHLTRSVEL